jgi:pilus assembly protein TadC
VLGESASRARLRAELIDEARENEENEARTALKLKKFRLASMLSGGLLFFVILSVVPFLAGHSLHYRWETIGKYLVMLAMGLLPVFMFTAGMTYGLWRYARAMKAIHKKYAPPLSKHRTGSKT